MWIVYGAWGWLIVSSLVIFNTRGEVVAANFALPGLFLVLLIHGGVWIYRKNKRPRIVQHLAGEPSEPTIDDSIYEQVAAELSTNQIHAGLMARAIAEADGDKDKTQAIYIKLRVAAIVAEHTKAKPQETERRDDIKEDFFQDAINRGEQEKQQAKNDTREFIEAVSSKNPAVEVIFLLLSALFMVLGVIMAYGSFAGDSKEPLYIPAAILFALGAFAFVKISKTAQSQSTNYLEKELQARLFKKEMIAKNEKSKNQKNGDLNLVRALLAVFVIMIAAAIISHVQQPDKPASSSAQQPAPPSLQREYDQLAKAHPDFKKVAMDPAFQEWIKNQPDHLLKLYASTSADDNIVLLNIYKNTINN
jgi:hypothetical protein